MPTALLFVRKIHEKLFLQAGNGGVMQQNKVKIKTVQLISFVSE